MFKLAIDAGHYLKTAGKRVLKKLDKNQTREWVLNDRIARYVAQYAAEYADVEILRVDDVTGKTLVGLQERCDKANEWKADLYLSIHHNAGILGGKGGGIVAYGYKKPYTYRDAIYNACVKATGLKGNRSKPLVSKGYHVLKHTKMMGVLMECGFMDSSTDAPIILTEDYAKKIAKAMVEAIAQVAGLAKRQKTVSIKLPVLTKGAKGQSVQAMQSLLVVAGFPCGDKGIDGSFGADTQTALQGFQKKSGIKETGICDQAAWKLLLGAK